MSEEVVPAKLPITDLKIVLGALFSAHMAVDKAKANDGKIDFQDLPLIYEPVTRAIAAVPALKQVIPQYKDIDAEERVELNAWVAETYDIADDSVEEKVEQAFAILFQLSVFFK